jgi:deoxyribodipyrimidine photo-lyase
MDPLPQSPWTQTPTRSAAVARVACINPAAYARTRNHLQGAVTGLSPYLTHGLLTLPGVLAQLLQSHTLTIGHKLVFELGWREYFRHVWHHAGPGIFQSLHTGPLPDSAYATELPPDIAQGRTGVPVIDQAVRTLYATGTLHNHARMWLASYVVHLRRVHWRAGADWLVAHLLDGDLGSNHLSWQWVAGTGSHKPYLFNADNVARYAPASWHSPGTVIDQSYDALERMARGQLAHAGSEQTDALTPTTEVARYASPPSGLRVPEATADPLLSSRQVWLLHPWALRAPPSDLPADAMVIGLYLKEYHTTWPWSEARWQWVDAAMQAITPLRWWTDARGLAEALRGAARVRTVDDPHISPWLQSLAEIEPSPALFPSPDRPCGSFSQWWNRATRGLKGAEELL